MLSGETAKGAYPIETVDMMSKICTDAESAINYDVLFNTVKDSSPDCGPDESVACAAVKCATEQNAKAIITMTTSGRTARLLAKYRPACPIIPVSKDVRAARQLHLSRGCYPLYYPGIGDSEQSATIVERVNYGPDHPSLLRPTHERAPHTRMHTRTAALLRSAISIAHSLGVIPPSCSY